jgi:hypothetical protein
MLRVSEGGVGKSDSPPPPLSSDITPPVQVTLFSGQGATVATIYAAVGAFGYMTFGSLVCSNVTESYPRDVLVAIAQVH